MTQWQHIGIDAWLEHTVETGEQTESWTWRYRVPKLWREAYGHLVDDPATMWNRLGDDGWEMVTALETRRDQFVENVIGVDGKTYQQFSGVLTGVTFSFKRPRPTDLTDAAAD